MGWVRNRNKIKEQIRRSRIISYSSSGKWWCGGGGN
jgi:hypothetical protein